MTEQPLIMEENGKRYRLLQVGETTEEGDQARYLGAWHPLVGFGNKIEANAGDAFPQGYYRRELKP